jgi:hypothetical protein
VDEVIPVSKAGSIVSCGGVELFVNGLFGLVVDFSKYLFLGDAFDDGQVDLAILYVNLVLGDIGSKDSVLHCLFLLNLVFY